MAGQFCIFLDFGSVSTHSKLNLLCLPSMRLCASHSHNPRINVVRRRSLHLRLLSKPAPLPHYCSNLEVISTHEHSDGSLLFRFGDPSEVAKNAEMEESETAKEATLTESKDGHGGEKVLDDVHESEMMVNVADREMTSSSLTEVVHRNNSTVISNKSSTVLAGGNDLNGNFPEDSNDHNLPTISNGELKAASGVDTENIGDGNSTGELLEKETSELTASVSSMLDPLVALPEIDVIQASLETIATVHEPGDSEHRNMETVMQTEIVDGDIERVQGNLVPSHHSLVKCQNLQSGMQNSMSGKGSGGDMNVLTALEMQNTLAGTGRGINSDVSEAKSVANSIAAEGQASGAGIELAHEAIEEDTSESGRSQLTIMSPQREVETMLDEKADTGTMEIDEAESRALNVDLVEASGYEETGLKSTESATSKDISMADFDLLSGAALLPHPSKVERMHILLLVKRG